MLDLFVTVTAADRAKFRVVADCGLIKYVADDVGIR